jgi:hypothetical protein
MMTKVSIVDGGDTQFLEGALEHKYDFLEENNRVFGLKVVVDAGDSKEFKPGQMITARELRDENSKLRVKIKLSRSKRSSSCYCNSCITRYYKSSSSN